MAMAVQTLTNSTIAKLRSCASSAHAKPALNVIKYSPADWIKQLFLRFTVIYRNLWADAFATDEMLLQAQYEWEETLSEFDEAIIWRSLNECKKLYKTFPPQPGGFYEIAKKEAKIAADNAAMAERTLRTAIAVKPNLEHGHMKMQEIKNILRAKGYRFSEDKNENH